MCLRHRLAQLAVPMQVGQTGLLRLGYHMQCGLVCPLVDEVQRFWAFSFTSFRPPFYLVRRRNRHLELLMDRVQYSGRQQESRLGSASTCLFRPTDCNSYRHLRFIPQVPRTGNFIIYHYELERSSNAWSCPGISRSCSKEGLALISCSSFNIHLLSPRILSKFGTVRGFV